MNKIIVILLLFNLAASAQQLELKESVAVNQVNELMFDLQGNLYVATDYSLIKFSPDLENKVIYSSERKITGFSVPSKWKIFIINDNQIQTLNNQFSPLGESVTFEDKVYSVDASNNVWRKGRNNTLIKTDLISRREIMSINPKGEPEKIFLADDDVYIKTGEIVRKYSGSGILKSEIELKGDIVFNGNSFFTINKNLLIAQGSEEQLELPIISKTIAVGNQVVALYSDGIIYIYNIKK